MDENIIKYRKMHRRCRHCFYYDRRWLDAGICKMKNKEIDQNWNPWAGVFCRYYKPDIFSENE